MLLKLAYMEDREEREEPLATRVCCEECIDERVEALLARGDTLGRGDQFSFVFGLDKPKTVEIVYVRPYTQSGGSCESCG